MIGAKELLHYSDSVRILYVEDDKKLREDTYRLLSTFFKQIVVAENGKQALDLYQPGEFDIVISDYVMPEVSGLELAQHIKSQSRDQILIILSAHDEQQYVEELKQAGVTEFIFKPLNIQQFIEVMHRTCALVEARRV